MEAATPIVLKPTITMSSKEGEILLATVPMPDAMKQKAGTKNELEVKVRYLKDGMGRTGRGFYLTLHGNTIDGIFKSCMLLQDPSIYILVEPCKRFGQKALEKAANLACENFHEQVEQEVQKARDYYLSKTFEM